MKWVMCLNDGETYTSLDGCAILPIPENIPDAEVASFVKHSDGWYCFDDVPPPELSSNNDYGEAAVEAVDKFYNYNSDHRPSE